MRRRDMVAGSAAIAAAGAARPLAAGERLRRPSGDRYEVLSRPGDVLNLDIEFLRDETQELRGRETVRYLRRPDGLAEVTALSISDNPRVTRFSWHLLRPDWRPVECAVTITADGRFAGSGHYVLGDGEVAVRGFTGDGTAVEQVYPLSAAAAALVSHTVSSDVMASRAAPARPAGGRTPGIFLTSADPYGRTVPGWVPADASVNMVGEETLTTPAGAFTADRFVLSLPKGDGTYAPFEDLWCLRGTAIFLGAHARAPTSTRYVLRAISGAMPR